jgi:hypothetical protein
MVVTAVLTSRLLRLLHPFWAIILVTVTEATVFYCTSLPWLLMITLVTLSNLTWGGVKVIPKTETTT